MAVTRPGLPSSPGLDRVTIPKLNQDPIQSLCPFSVEVTMAGHVLTVPALPASRWLSVLMVENLALDDVFPGLLSDGDVELAEEALLEGAVDLDELEGVILGVIEMASARSWWVTLRLVEIARTSWDVVGAELGLRGVDPTRISLSQWLDVLLMVIIRSMDPKDVQMFTMRLEAPPVGEEVDETKMEISESSFMAMAR